MFFVIQWCQHRFLPEQPCRQPLKWVLGSLYFQKLYEFLFSLCFPEVHNPKVSHAKLSIVVRKLLLCHGKKIVWHKYKYNLSELVVLLIHTTKGFYQILPNRGSVSTEFQNIISAADFEVLRTTGTHGPLSYKTDGTHSFKFLAQAL